MTEREVLRCPQQAGVATMFARQAGAGDREWEYIHHVNGRLRVRAAALRKNRDRAEAIESTVNSIDGVSAAAVNLLTGSLTIIYEPSVATPEFILDVLRHHGLAASPVRHNSQGTSVPANTAVRNAGRAVLYLVLEQMIERSLKAACAALL
jgi:cation transport ATPase